jgi:hypothetical protein
MRRATRDALELVFGRRLVEVQHRVLAAGSFECRQYAQRVLHLNFLRWIEQDLDTAPDRRRITANRVAWSLRTSLSPLQSAGSEVVAFHSTACLAADPQRLLPVSGHDDRRMQVLDGLGIADRLIESEVLSLKLDESSVHSALITRNASSSITSRSLARGKEMPYLRCSASCQASPSPNSSRLPEM